MKKYVIILFSYLSILISANVAFNIDGVEDCGFVSVTGSWDNWSGWGANNDNGFSIELSEGNYEFVILCVNTEGEWWNDIWNNSNIFNAPIGGACWNGNNEYANYTLSVSGDTSVSYCAGTCSQSCDESDDGLVYNLVWSDEFNASEIDESKWNFEIGTGNWGWGNGEHQYYTSRSENSFIEDGKLIIQALNESYQGSNYTSARMTTKNKGDWLYGKIKARIKVPSAGGTWPAFWMMPTSSVYGGWPNSGEMDIMEHYGCNNGEVSATVHNNLYNWNGGTPPTTNLYHTTANSDFHEYEMEWNESELKFFVDGIFIGSYYNQNNGWEQWPYDQEFFIILNLAIGSHFMPCDTQDNLFPQRYEIDYVRVYQLSEQVVLYGDVNQDNSLNVMDIVIIVQFIIGNATPTDQQQLIGDINQDNSLDVVDIVALIQNIVN